MKIYTKTGDTGTTGLLGGTRVTKHHYRIEAYGTVDELNSWIGLLASREENKDRLKILNQIQHTLFNLGSQLAADPEKAVLKSGKKRFQTRPISDKDIGYLEEQIDAMNSQLTPMTHFILPGGHEIVSYCHIARTVCRRTERKITHLHEQEPLDDNVLAYVNRLSDYLFILARMLSKELRIDEIKWIPKAED